MQTVASKRCIHLQQVGFRYAKQQREQSNTLIENVRATCWLSAKGECLADWPGHRDKMKSGTVPTKTGRMVSLIMLQSVMVTRK